MYEYEIDKNKIPNIICIYLLKCEINNKEYVGQSRILQSRMRQHKSEKKCIIDKAIQKYGWNNFKLIILHTWNKIPEDEYEMDAMEIAWIDHQESLIKQGGYNKSLFGFRPKGYRHSKKTKLKLSLAIKGKRFGENHPLFDKNIYHFINIITNENFIGYRFHLIKKYNLFNGNFVKMMQGKRSHCSGWTLLSNTFDPSFIGKRVTG